MPEPPRACLAGAGSSDPADGAAAGGAVPASPFLGFQSPTTAPNGSQLTGQPGECSRSGLAHLPAPSRTHLAGSRAEPRGKAEKWILAQPPPALIVICR